MKHLIFYFVFVVMIIVQPAQAVDGTKSQGTLMDWTLLDDTAGTCTVESAAFDLSGNGGDLPG